MKKIFFLLGMLVFSQASAIDYSCFEYSGEVNPGKKSTFELSVERENIYFFQDGTLLQTKYYKEQPEKNISYIQHNTLKKVTDTYYTFEQYDENKFYDFHFENILPAGTFSYNFSSNNDDYKFLISQDGKGYFEIQNDLTEYDLKYVRIQFKNNKGLKNTQIFTLTFTQDQGSILLVNSISPSKIFAYSRYVCDDNSLSELLQKTKNEKYFPVDVNTQKFSLTLSKNPQFDTQHVQEIINRDNDNDGIINTLDNCIDDYNPDQKDSDASGVGDVCSDKDNDYIVGKKDNCPLLSNNDQKDENKNGIGDVCETDTDKDGIFDVEDNCSLVANPLQYDTDNDGIGDECDNCIEKYNPDQKNIDKDSLGDSCDEKDDRFIESNRIFFIGLLIGLVIIFLVGIIIMFQKVKKLQNIQK